MGTLRMNSEDLRNLGNGIVSNSDSFDTLISNFQNAYEAITADGTWDGDDSNKFNEAASKLKINLDKASSIVREVGNDLVNTATDYEDTNSRVTSNIGSMF